MSIKINNLYEFGEFRLDAEERVLYRNGQPLTLAPKVFETLLVVIERRGTIVTKEDLMNEVWQDSFVEESNLTQNIYTLRQIFGKRNKFIETIPRRGYRFTADVRTVGSDLSPDRQNRAPDEIVITRKTTATILREEIIEEDGEDVYLVQRTKILPEAQSSPVYKSRKFHLGLVFGILAALILGAVVFSTWRRNFASPSTALLEKVTFSGLTNSGNIRQIALSPDGQFLAFISSDSNKLWLKDVNSRQDLALTLAQDFAPRALSFSPDGNSIYFLNRKTATGSAEVYKTSRFGGNAEFVVGNVWSEFAVSAGADKIAFYRKSPEENKHFLVVADLVDKREQVLLTREFPEGFDLSGAPAWSPDGKDIYVVSKPQEKPNSVLLKVNSETGTDETIDVPQIRQFVTIVALPDNENLIFTAREPNKFPQVFKMKKTGGIVQRLTNDLNVYRELSLSSDGKRLVALQRNNASHIWTLPDFRSEKSRQLTFGTNNRDGRHGLDILPDGKIVFTSLEGMDRQIWILNPQDNSKLQLTANKDETNERPFVDANGDFIFFSSLNEQNYDIKKIQPDGQNLQHITIDTAANDLFPIVSGDGTTLYFIRKNKGSSVIVKKSLRGGEEREIDLPEGFSPDGFLELSPNGKFLAFQLADLVRRNDSEEESSKPAKLGIISTDGDLLKATTTEINTSPTQFRWSAQSDSIYFVNHSEGSSSIWKKKAFETSEPMKVVELNNTRIYYFQITNDNNAVVSHGRRLDDAILIQNFE